MADSGRAGWERAAWAEVDLGAIRQNATALRDAAAPAQLCAVVKANGYGHGAVDVARAAIAGGATWLAVALVEEGLALREAGITAPVLLLSQPSPAGIGQAVAHGLTPTVYTPEGVAAAAAAATAGPVDVHVKVDTGMHRVGVAPGDALALVKAVHEAPGLRFAGLWTHFPVADEPDKDAATEAQLERLANVAAELTAAGFAPPMLHAANSAGALAHPTARLDLVRCGIALYGYAPCAPRGGPIELQPALSLKARVSHVQRLPAGERISYGWRYQLAEPSLIATVPLGYADGVTRALAAAGGQVLIGGKRRPIAGTVTMDQLMVDCGTDDVAVGDEVVLIGRQGTEAIRADEWAGLLGTIAYEVLCGIGPRVPRVTVGGDRA